MAPPVFRPRLRRRPVVAALVTAGFVLGGSAVVAVPAAAAEPVAGARTSGDSLFPNVGNGGYDVQHYDLDLDYRANDDVSAVATISAVADTALSSFSLDFEGMTVDSVSVNGEDAAFTREEDADAILYKLDITPAAPVEGAFTVEVAYSGAPSRHRDPDGSSEGWVKTSDGVTALGQPIGAMTWFPQNNTPSDKATYDISVTAPAAQGGKPLAVASNGELAAKTEDAAAGTITWDWRQTNPMATELSILSIGNYEVLESDIALASGRTIHEWTFVDSAVAVQTVQTSSGPRTRLDLINDQRARLTSIIDWLESKLGAYPGNSVGLIVDSAGVGYALETQDRPFFDRGVSADTLVHELVHQWLGNDVSPSDWSNIWVNEGPAELFTSYYNYENGLTDTTPEEAARELWEESDDEIWSLPLSGFTDPADLYSYVYERGQATLGALMSVIGRDAFDATYRMWTERYADGVAGTDELIALAEETSGRDLDAFFQDWIFDTDKPATWPTVALNLLNINDFHGRIDANTVKFAGTIEKLRAEYGDDNTMLLSAGDNIGASLFASSYFEDQPTIDVLNALELEASAVGNHEFDKGFADLKDRVTDAADFTYLGANVYAKGTTNPVLPEYATFEVEGLTVGVIGAVTQETPTLVSPGGIADLDFGDPVEAVNRVAAQLTDGDPSNGEADVIIAEYHEGAGSGTPEGATLEDEIAAGGAFASIVQDTSAAVDVIFTGHTHKMYAWSAPVPGQERTRAVVQTGNYGENIGQVVLQLDANTGDVLSYSAGNVARLAIEDDGNKDNDAEQSAALDAELVDAYPRVAAVKEIVDEALAQAAIVGAQPVGSVTADITTAFSGGSYQDGVYTGGKRDDRGSQSTLGNLVADAIRDTLADPDRGGADIALVNPGGLRDELLFAPDGVITYAEANAVLPFVNNLWTTTLTGAQVKATLEEQWQTTVDGSTPARPYLALGLSDNVSYTFDDAAPQGSHITGVWIDGTPIDPNGQYRVGSFNFLLQGGDNFRTLAEGADTRDSGLIDRDAWIAYLQEHEDLAPSFASRSAQVTGVPASVAPGQSFTMTVSKINLTSLGSPENTSLEPTIGTTAYPPVAVSNGSATVTLNVPADASVGMTELVLTAPDSGTVVRVPLNVTATPPSTGGSETPAPESALTPEKENAITVQGGTSVAVGATVTIHVGEQYAGQWVSVWLRSEPILVGWYQVDVLGNITVTLPAGVSGAHRLVVQDADGNVIGWQQVQIGSLPATGVEGAPLLGIGLIALMFVGAGVAARTVRRRRTV